MNIPLLSLLDPAVERTRTILFRPFDLVKWLVIGFACWLARLAQFGSYSSFETKVPRLPSNPQDGAAAASEIWHSTLGALGLVAILIIAVIGLALLVLFLWLGAMGQFIFLDNVVRNRGAIVEPWNRYRREGWSLFLWRLAFAAIVLGSVVLVLLALLSQVSWAWLEGAEWIDLPFSLWFYACVLLAGAVLLAYVDLFLNSFVVPIMYREGLTVTAAWRRFLPLLRENLGGLALYGLVILALGVGLGMLVMAVGCFTCCLGFLLLLLPYVGTVLLLPAWVFLRSYSLGVLAVLDPTLDLFALPPVPPEPGLPALPQATEDDEVAPESPAPPGTEPAAGPGDR